MLFKAAMCPACGGSLQVPEGREVVKCMYCGVDVVVREAAKLVQGDAENFLELARQAEIASNSEEAYKYFTKVLELQPTNTEAWLGKGTAAGWQSTLRSLRLNEMVVAFNNSLKFTPEEHTDVARRLCALKACLIANACYKLSCDHMTEFASVDSTWPEHLDRCGQLIETFEYCISLQPQDVQFMKSVIEVCKNNIEGYTYTTGQSAGRRKVTETYEQELRSKIAKHSQEIQKLEPGYEPPNPQKPGCFVITATMGDERHPAVQILRSFRDESLVHHSVGRAFIDWYHENGPRVATHVERSRFARVLSLVFVVAPAVALVELSKTISRLTSSFRVDARKQKD